MTGIQTIGSAAHGYIALEARDADRNIARRYLVEISTDLFGTVIVESSWGRIGSRGQSRRVSFSGRELAHRHVERTLHKRAMAIKRIGTAYRIVEQTYELWTSLSSARSMPAAF